MQKTEGKRFICLAALAVMGEIMISIYFTQNTTDDMLGLLLAFAASLGTVLILKKLCDKWRSKSFAIKKPLEITLSAAGCLLFLTVALFTVFAFSEFAADVMLTLNGILLPFLSFTILVILFSRGNDNLRLKTALILFPISAAVIIIIFSFSLPYMSVKYIIPYKPLSGGIPEIFLPLYLRLSTVAFPLVFIGRHQRKRSFAVAYILAFALLLLVFISVVMIFGGELAATLKYPYSQAVSTAAMGEVFSRMDGFLYCLCFFTCLIKSAVCISAGFSLLKSMLSKILC